MTTYPGRQPRRSTTSRATGMPTSRARAQDVSTSPVTSARRPNGTRSATHAVVAASKDTFESCTTTMARANSTTTRAPRPRARAPTVTQDRGPTLMAVRAPRRSAARPTAGAGQPGELAGARARPIVATDVPQADGDHPEERRREPQQEVRRRTVHR